MKVLDINSTGELTLEKNVINAKPLGEPLILRHYQIEDMCCGWDVRDLPEKLRNLISKAEACTIGGRISYNQPAKVVTDCRGHEWEMSPEREVVYQAVQLYNL